ncbi:hypothetical protein ACWEKT_32075 [Nocardia takedensis]
MFEPATGAITMNAGFVWAVVIDAALGSAVRDELHERDVLGPIISHPDTATWTLLTRSDIAVPLLVEAEQWSPRVRVLRGGSRPPPPPTRRREPVWEGLDDVFESPRVADVITLPSPIDQGHRLRQWIVEARDDVRPSGVVVIDAVRAAIRRVDAATRARAAAL